MAQPFLQINAGEAGLILEFDLSFTDYDPTGAQAQLVLTGLGRSETRTLTLVGSVATYVVASPTDLARGYWSGTVFVSGSDALPAVTVTSQPFILAVV